MELQYDPAPTSDQSRSDNRFVIVGLLVLVCILGVSIQLILKRHRDQRQTNLALTHLAADSLKCRLALSKYLLSGDVRELSTLNELNQSVIDQLKSLKEKEARSLDVTYDIDRLIAFQQDWSTDFAKHLVDKRKEVDEGHASVADLQIRYLMEDPQGWDKRLDDQFDRLQKALNER